MDLAVKYRPMDFEAVVGQEHVTSILENQIMEGTVAHAYIFAGPSGDGKTTTARIFANRLNGSKSGTIEIDGASNNGVENIRELRETCKYKPIGMKYKIYIIDEVHMLSIGAFNALLKTLEEPPAHCVFILCTTDPQKIPATVISRCQRFDFRRVADNLIKDRLKYIVDEENKEKIEDNCGSRDAVADPNWAKYEGIKLIDCDDEVLEFIAKLSNGGVRRAITLLDTCINYPSELTLEVVSDILGVASYETLYELFKAIAFKDGRVDVIRIIEDQFNRGRDLKLLYKQEVEFAVEVCKFFMLGVSDLVKLPSDILEDIADTFVEWGVNEIVDIVDSMLVVMNSIKYETDVKTILIGELITI